MSGRTGWGKPEWQKPKYQPTPDIWTGKWIFCNATKQDTEWTPNGQNVTLTIGSTKVTLAPGERCEFQPKNNNSVTIKAKPQLSAMKSNALTIGKPLSPENHYVWVWANPTHQFQLGFTFKTQGAPR